MMFPLVKTIALIPATIQEIVSIQSASRADPKIVEMELVRNEIFVIRLNTFEMVR